MLGLITNLIIIHEHVHVGNYMYDYSNTDYSILCTQVIIPFMQQPDKAHVFM